MKFEIRGVAVIVFAINLMYGSTVFMSESLNGSVCYVKTHDDNDVSESRDINAVDIIEQIVVLADANHDKNLENGELLRFLEERVHYKNRAYIDDLCRDIGRDKNPHFMGYFMARYGHRSGGFLDDLANKQRIHNYPLSSDHAIIKAYYDRDLRKWRELSNLPCHDRLLAITSPSSDWSTHIFESMDINKDDRITIDEFYYSGGIPLLWARIIRPGTNRSHLTRDDMRRFEGSSRVSGLVSAIYPYNSLPIAEARVSLNHHRIVLNALVSRDALPKYYHTCALSKKRSYTENSIQWHTRPLESMTQIAF